MKYYFLFVLLPLLIFNLIRKKKRSEEAAHRAESVRESVDEAIREAEMLVQETPSPEKPKVQPVKPVPVHTEGKHPDEIKEEKLRLAALEHTNTETEATRREIREMDLKQLRRAVVMSEILDRPVSLRRRGYR